MMKQPLMIGTFIAFIFGGLALNIITPDRQLSETENRPLQQLPTLTKDNFLSGEFMTTFETYVTDQFFAKDWWVGVKAEMELLLQKGENNGVYFGKEGHLLEAFTEVGPQFEKNLGFLNLFQEKMPQLSTTVLLIPTATEVYREKLPLFAPVVNQSELLTQAEETLSLPVVNPLETLSEHREEPLYYKTDHHWTTLGAFYTYQVLMKAWGTQPYLDYETEVVSTDFYGTYYSKANQKRLPADSITLYHPKDEVGFSTEFNGTTLDGLYDERYLNKKDQYSLFLGGNQPLTVIRSGIKNGKKLAIFKDSYAHSFAPFLAMHFEEIHLIDLRYFNQNPYHYLSSEGFDQVLFLYNLSTFKDETSLIKLKAVQP